MTGDGAGPWDHTVMPDRASDVPDDRAGPDPEGKDHKAGPRS